MCIPTAKGYFSGCGGMSYGFILLGKMLNKYRHIAAFDNDKHANKTFLTNFGDEPINCDLGEIELDVIDEIINNKRRIRFK